MRASRLLSILTTLQAKGHVTAQALADECEVSLRTIYRDVEALSAAGIPVYSERGSSGGYRLLDGYRVRLNGLSSTEAEALFLAGLTRQATDLGLGPVAASARKKLLAALPAKLRPGALRARFHLDAPAWFAEGESLKNLPLVADAVWSEHPITMLYKGRDTTAERTIEPLGIVLKGGAWYLAAQSDGGVRTYRVARILKLTILDRPFDYPKSFDLEAIGARARADTRRDYIPIVPSYAFRPGQLRLCTSSCHPMSAPVRSCPTRSMSEDGGKSPSPWAPSNMQSWKSCGSELMPRCSIHLSFVPSSWKSSARSRTSTRNDERSRNSRLSARATKVPLR